MPVERRDFLKSGIGLVSAGLVVPSFLAETARLLGSGPSVALAADPGPKADRSRRILVVVQLAGGNDGLNTLVHYADPLYYRARPTLAIPREQVLPLDGNVGFTPHLKHLKARYDAGQVAVVQGVGYPNPGRSHFHGMEIWQTAVPDQLGETGWLGRYLQACVCGTDKHLEGIVMGGVVPKSCWTELTLVPAIANLAAFHYGSPRANPAARGYEVQAPRTALTQSRGRPEEEFLRRSTQVALDDADVLGRVADGYQTVAAYPTGYFAESLKTIAQIIAGDVGTRVFVATLGGFDTHAGQAAHQQRLLTDLDNSLEAFMQDLERLGRQDDVMVMTFSEFGRRVTESGSNGTDHGTAEPLLILGGGLRGGLHGAYPSLSELDRGDLKYTTDFRSVYGSVLHDWLGASGAQILGGTFPRLSLAA